MKLTKARVDTHWKKQPLGVSNANANAGAAKATAASLMRSNSMRTHGQQPAAGASQISASTLNAGRTAATTTANAKVAADANNKRKYPIRKHKTLAQPKSHMPTSQRTVAAAAKQKSISDEKVNTLRREDSNLSRKSLTKLRAALAKPNVPAVAAVNAQKKEPLVTRAQTRTAANALAVKKDVAAAAVHLKKEPTALARLPKMRPTPAVAAATVPSTLSLAGKRLAEVEDIDADDRENLVLVSEYVNDIYDYLYELEEQQPIQTDHLANQLEVSHKMRAVLIDWINEVHLQFHLAAETFHLAVAIIDRYLQVVKNTRRKYLQLVGVTALFIATKYEELFPPAIGDFVFITDDSYTGREIRQMELQILKAIDNNLSRPLPIHFLRRYSKAASAEDEHHAMSKYFLELAAMDYELASYKPSEVGFRFQRQTWFLILICCLADCSWLAVPVAALAQWQCTCCHGLQ